MTLNVSITALAAQDIGPVSEIEQRAGDVRWSLAQFEKEMTLEFSRFFVLREGPNILGYGGYWKVGDEAQITNLVIHPDARRRGLGQGLLDDLLARARREGCRKVTLEVRRRNSPAQMLYLNAGFALQGRRPQVYTDPPDDAILMEKVL